MLLLVFTNSFAMNKERILIDSGDGHRMPVLVYRPDRSSDQTVTGVLWIHGGGYITGMASMAGMMGMGPRIVNDHGCVVVSPVRTSRRSPSAGSRRRSMKPERNTLQITTN